MLFVVRFATGLVELASSGEKKQEKKNRVDLQRLFEQCDVLPCNVEHRRVGPGRSSAYPRWVETSGDVSKRLGRGKPRHDADAEAQQNCYRGLHC